MFKIDTNLLSNLNVKFQVDKNLNIINFITTKFGIIKFFIYLFWTLDLLKFKFFMGR